MIKLSGASGDGKASRRAAAVKQRRGWRVAFVALAAIGVVAAAAWVLFASSLLAVRSVVVSGTRLVPRSEVLAAAGIRPGTPMIRVNIAQIETGSTRSGRSAAPRSRGPGRTGWSSW